MRNFGLYFFGACLLIFSVTVMVVANKISNGVEDMKYVIAQAPVVIDKVRELKVDVDAMTLKVQHTVDVVKAAVPEALPEAGSRLGVAGANALKSFSKRMSSFDNSEQDVLSGSVENVDSSKSAQDQAEAHGIAAEDHDGQDDR